MSGRVRIEVEVGDIRRLAADVIALKFAPGVSGASGAVATALGKTEAELRGLLPSAGSLCLLPGKGRIAAPQALLVGVDAPTFSSDEEIRQFARAVLRGARVKAPGTRHLGLTVHGLAFGDVEESLRSQLQGIVAAVAAGECPPDLEKITIVDRNPVHVRLLQDAVSEALADRTMAAPPPASPAQHAAPEGNAPLGGSAFDVFISYKSEDTAYARQVFDFLRAHGRHVFFSRESLPRLGSDEYHRQIDLAIEQARHLVVVTTSGESALSQWVQYEWRLFMGEKLAGRKPGNLMTVIAGAMTIGDLPISLRNREVIRLAPEEMARLLEYTRTDVLAAEPAPERPASPALVATVAGVMVATATALENVSWSEASAYGRSTIAGQDGWRLPSLDELRQIRLASLFGDGSCYWSGQEASGHEAFYMHFDDGHVGRGPKSFSRGLSAIFVKDLADRPTASD